jgi:hypothetical protein
MQDIQLSHATSPQALPLRVVLGGHLAIARLDHSIKNIFVLPGIILPLAAAPNLLTRALIPKLILGFLATTLIACSNYVINEVLDAPVDRLHPTKCMRPAAMGIVSITGAYSQWIAMMIVGLLIAWQVSGKFMLTAASLWVMGCIYNIPPLRAKDVPYADVLIESVNNPIRMLLGWFYGYFGDHAADFPAGRLLDDRLLFHGAQTVQRVPPNRSIACRRLSQFFQVVYRGVASRIRSLLCLARDAAVWRLHDALSH